MKGREHMRISLEDIRGGQGKVRPALQKLFALERLFEVTTLRRLVQLAILAMCLVAAWNFSQFVEYIRYGGAGEAPSRPPVAEGFLPIAAIVAFKAFVATRVIDPIHPAGLVIFIATVSTAWIFRRALCSWICPIGTFSEWLAGLGKRAFGKNLTVPRWLDIALVSLKYALFFYVARILLLLPASAAMEFMRIPYYSISDIKMFDMFASLSATGAAIIGALVLLSIPIKSLWCRYLCPYGALLGVIGFLSPVFLTKDDATCAGCGACNRACPNRVDVQRKRAVVTSTECTGCASCVVACPNEETLQFKLFGLFPVPPVGYAVAFLAVFFGIIAMAKLTGHWETSLSISDYVGLDRLMSGGFGGS